MVAVEVEQGAVREAGTAPIFMQGCTNLAPSPVQELLNHLFTCHTHGYPKIAHLAERAGGKTKTPEQGNGEWWARGWGRKVHHSYPPWWKNRLSMSPVLWSERETAQPMLQFLSADGCNFLTKSSSSSLPCCCNEIVQLSCFLPVPSPLGLD